MDDELLETSFERYKPFVLPVLLGIFSICLLGFGIYSVLKPSVAINNKTEITQASPIPTSEPKIKVDVSGAVQNPGVYALPLGSRVQDAIFSAGNLSAQADKNWVAKNINYAAIMVDGGKLYIPKLGENTVNNTSGTVAGTMTTAQKINLNTATLSELDELPGVGKITAQKILDGRPYGKIEELTSKKIVGSSEFDKIKTQITVY